MPNISNIGIVLEIAGAERFHFFQKGCVVWEERINWPEHSICFGCEDAEFNKDNSAQIVAAAPKTVGSDAAHHVVSKYNVYCVGKDASILAGFAILLTTGLCPPFEACPNRNLFQHFIVIKFHHDGHTYVCAISTFGFTYCFNLVNSILPPVPQRIKIYGLDASMHAKTLVWVFDQVLS